MALTLLGTASANGDGSADLTVTHPGGIAENDTVFFAYCEGSNDFNMQMTTSGYTELADVGATGALQGNLGVYRKVMGATPDSTAVCDNGAPTGGNFSMAAAECVYSGVDTTTPEDATTLASIVTFSDTQPNSASITTVTDNAVVLTIGFKNTTGATPGSVTAPSGYANTVQDSNDGSREAQIAIADKTKTTAGAEDPAAWSGFASYAFASVAQATVAIRPAAGGGGSTITTEWWARQNRVPRTPDRGSARAFLHLPVESILAATGTDQYPLVRSRQQRPPDRGKAISQFQSLAPYTPVTASKDWFDLHRAEPMQRKGGRRAESQFQLLAPYTPVTVAKDWPAHERSVPIRRTTLGAARTQFQVQAPYTPVTVTLDWPEAAVSVSIKRKKTGRVYEQPFVAMPPYTPVTASLDWFNGLSGIQTRPRWRGVSSAFYADQGEAAAAVDSSFPEFVRTRPILALFRGRAIVFYSDFVPPEITPTGIGRVRRRYRALLDDGTIIWGESPQQVRELKKKYEKTLQPPPIGVKTKQKLRVERADYVPPNIEYYAQPIPNVFTRIDLRGDPNALLALLRMELDDDEEAIQIALDLML